MQESLFGIETEYSFTHFAANGEAMDRSAGLGAMLGLAQTRFKCLRDLGHTGFYLSNGSRLYIDVGRHPELSTPECLDPWEAVRYLLAGDRILADLAGEVERKCPGSRASVYRCNVDYVSGETWGCHESYLHRTRPTTLAEEIVPHLVSRLIYTGSGGFDNGSPGLEFTLSPRVPHLGKTVSAHSTHDRGIFHTKDEPLCGKDYHRLHVLCGESQCSRLGAFLKIGATALVVRMIEAGVCRGSEMALQSPIAAMRRFSTDPSCQRRERLRNGKQLRALEIQHHYLEAAEAHLSRGFMPPWAGEVCAEWRRMLDRLEGGADAASTVLDWGIKLSLFREQARKRGFQWHELARWTPLIRSVATALGHPETARHPIDPARILGGDRAAEEGSNLAALLAQRGTGREELRAFLALRAALFEIDTRFGEVGPRGIFTALDREGVLDHGLSGLGDVEAAIEEPPARGRAHQRGTAILRHCGEPRRYTATWQAIFDGQIARVFDLSDPFGRGATWTASEHPRGRTRGAPARGAIRERVVR